MSLADLQTFRSSRKLFLTPDGQPLPVGSTLRNPDLARTYATLARYGARLPVRRPARRRHRARSSSTRRSCPAWPTFPIRPGSMTPADLAAYRCPPARPRTSRYRGLRRVRDAAVVVRRHHRRRGAEHPVRLPASARSSAPRRCSSTWRPPAWPSPTATPTSATPTTSTSRSTACSTRRTRPPGACLIENTALTSPVAPGDPYPPYGGCGRAKPRPRRTTRAARPTTSSPPTSGATSSATPTPSSSSPAAASPFPGRGFLLNNEMTDFDFAPATPGDATTRTCPPPASGRARACRRPSCSRTGSSTSRSAHRAGPRSSRPCCRS